ncbi:MAG TPA: hypothetical protein VLT86_05060 [Vicinamibacterales bacterium]|nr:hypothetical protein [Vicinamibacterales bacterium]
MRRLMFVHGRAQEFKDADALKREWLDAFRAGLKKSNLDLPIPESEVRFPYYGQTLYDMVAGTVATPAAVKVRGGKRDPEEQAFVETVLRQICDAKGITEDAIAAEQVAKMRGGPLNVEWVQRVLKAIDRHVPFGSGGSIALFTQDVYRYLRNIGIRDRIDMGIRQAMEPNVPTVVVSHSLGTVVSYSLLRRDGAASHWVVPLYVTLGSPLGVTAIRDGLAPNECPACVTTWFNAMDERDVVALYPLTPKYFPIDRPIDNKTDVQNHTDNRHGIAGYLDDAVVARRIYDALVA